MKNVASLACVSVALVVSAPAFAGREGDVLKTIFDKARVTILTNEPSALAEQLLAGCKPKEQQVLALTETATTDVVVRLENRWLGGDSSDEAVIEVVKRGKNAWNVTISAPDSASLRQAVLEFRKLAEPPKSVLRRKVRLTVVVPVGPGAALAATSLTSGGRMPLLTPEQYTAKGNAVPSDELVLWDRTAPSITAPTLLPANIACGSGETIAWREKKADGRFRTVIAAPTGALLTEALIKIPDLAAFTEKPTILASARDLRSVRRIAVSGLGSDPELVKKLAAQAASQLRTLDVFDVLERDGLTAILSEVALSQAGITSGTERARLQQLAAADTLLIVDVREATGKTEFGVSHERVTPKLGPPPSRPPEPSRLRFDLGGDDGSRKVAEALLGKSVGYKSELEYQNALDTYRLQTLPLWESRVRAYNNTRRTRAVTWTEKVLQKGNATVRGSVRLVDLTDGSVLWEQPILASESGEVASVVRNVTARGEETPPDGPNLPLSRSEPPPVLVRRAAENAVREALETLPRTALLPAVTSTTTATPSPTTSDGARILDIDAGDVLVALGASDGVMVGDVLLLRFDDNTALRLIVTKVRSRTCDAAFEAGTPEAVRKRVVVGARVERR